MTAEHESSDDNQVTTAGVTTRRKIAPKQEWRPFFHVIKDEQGSWLPIRSYQKRNARGAALSAAFKTESDEIAILDPYLNRVSLYKAKHEFIPEDRRTVVQKARLIDRSCKVFVQGHFKLQNSGSQELCLRDNRGRRPGSESDAPAISTTTTHAE